MSVRKLLLFFFACALTMSVNGAAQAGSAADQRLYEKARKACSGPQYPMAPTPISTTRAAGFDVPG